MNRKTFCECFCLLTAICLTFVCNDYNKGIQPEVMCRRSWGSFIAVTLVTAVFELHLMAPWMLFGEVLHALPMSEVHVSIIVWTKLASPTSDQVKSI